MRQNLAQALRLSVGWEFPPRNGPHSVDFASHCVLPVLRSFRMQPSQLPTITAYGPPTLAFEEPMFPPLVDGFAQTASSLHLCFTFKPTLCILG